MIRDLMLWLCSLLGLTRSLSPKQTPMTDGDDDGRVEDEEVKGMRWRTWIARDADANDNVQ